MYKELFLVPTLTTLDLDELGKHIIGKIPKLKNYKITQEPPEIKLAMNKIVSGTGYVYEGLWVEELIHIDMRPLDRVAIDPQLLVTDKPLFWGTPLEGMSSFILYGGKEIKFFNQPERVNRCIVSATYRELDSSNIRNIDKSTVYKAAVRKVAETLADKCYNLVDSKFCLLSNFTSPILAKGTMSAVYAALGRLSDDVYFLNFEDKLADTFCEMHKNLLKQEN